MFESGSQNWELFGYDLRLLGAQWRSAWRDFLWGSDSPVLERLDEPVRLRDESGEKTLFAGKPVNGRGESTPACEALLLPADEVLSKTLRLPLAVETELDAVMALEASANNPFPANDVASGWSVLGKTEEEIHVGLAIASMGGVMSYLAQHYDCHSPEAYEVWARVGNDGDDYVVLEGFGESKRRGRYRQRLQKMAALLGICALLVLAILGSAAAFRYVELQHYEEMSASVQREAQEASRAREALLLAGDTLNAATDYVAAYHNPHVELARLTALLGDDVSIMEFHLNGNLIKLRGRARDASSVVQQLIAEPAFLKVTSPRSISKIGNTGYEEFFVHIVLAGRTAS